MPFDQVVARLNVPAVAALVTASIWRTTCRQVAYATVQSPSSTTSSAVTSGNADGVTPARRERSPNSSCSRVNAPAVFATRSTATRVTSPVAPSIGMSRVMRIFPAAVKESVTVTHPDAPVSDTNPRTVAPSPSDSVPTSNAFAAAHPIAEVASSVTFGMEMAAPSAPYVRTSPPFVALTAFVEREEPA